MEYIQRIRKYRDTSIDPSLFNTYRTGTSLDLLLSSYVGLLKSFIYLLTGNPGSGKTTVVLDTLANLQIMNPGIRVLFISAEMNKFQLASYMARFQKCENIDILYVKPNDAEDNWEAIVAVLNTGYDVVAIDSVAEVENVIAEELGVSDKKAENRLLSLIEKQAQGCNNRKVLTSFLLIQQMTKSGDFLGSNRLQHDVDGTVVLKCEDKNPYSPRFITFTKHRGGTVGECLYYDLSTGRDVIYDGERLERERKLQKLQAEDAQNIRNAGDNFFSFYDNNPNIDEQ